ncbi:hypothetical protein TcYC6_0003900 [Trypanosoma cruzi]|nr:hypothetical protein TcYC6_0003900 [Trypanosoma cruzi]
MDQGGRGAAAAQGHSSGNQGASLGTQQQVSGLRPPHDDEKQSGAQPNVHQSQRSSNPLVHAAYRLRGSRSNALVISGRSEDDTVTHRGGPCPEKVSVNTQQADAATAEEERRRENTMLLERRSWRFRDSTGDHHQSKCCGSYWRR